MTHFNNSLFIAKDRLLTGFTLIELLLVITIFSIVVTAFMSLFSSAFKNQQESLDSSYLLNNASYITEYISRALRMAKKDIDGICISAKHNYELSDGDRHIKFLNYDNACQEFFLDVQALKIKKLGVEHSLTPSNIAIGNLKFTLLGELQTDSQQPRVSFVLELTRKEQTLEIQTTISQRNLDVIY